MKSRFRFILDAGTKADAFINDNSYCEEHRGKVMESHKAINEALQTNILYRKFIELV